MRAPAVSFANKFFAALMAALLTFTLLPASAFAEGEGGAVDAPTEESQGMSISQADEAAGVSTEADGSMSAASSAKAGTLAASLMGKPVSFVNADVTLDSEPVIGSFTVDGLTFATNPDGLTLVAVSSDWQQVTSSQEGESSGAAPMLASEPDGPGANGSALLLPGTVAYNDVEYSVTSIGAYAFYLSGVTSVELTASVVDIDDRAFRSSDVALVEVAEGNTSYSSFDGALYDADQLSLLLIPEGKQGTVLLPSTAESAAPSVFSHCPLVTQIAVEEGSAAFASENGLLYDASLTTLLRVPAGATEITIREGCTTIAAGAMEACASLATINASASITSISPDVFTSVPTVSLPAATLAEDAPQLSAMVALSSTDDALPDVNPSLISVALPESANATLWESYGFDAIASAYGDASGGSVASIQTAATSKAVTLSSTTVTTINNGAQYYCGNALGNATHQAGTFRSFTFAGGSLSWNSSYGYIVNYVPGHSVPDPWYWFSKGGRKARALCLGRPSASSVIYKDGQLPSSANQAVYLIFDFSISLNDNGGAGGQGAFEAFAKTDNPCPASLICPVREGYIFNGYYQLVNGEKKFWYQGTAEGGKVTQYNGGSNIPNQLISDTVLYADWLPAKYDVSFDTSSEPEDEDYPGIEKPDETINAGDGATVIEDPKRPGYVFQGWTIPNAEGTEAIDQELVYKDEADGKWYVDASKLPEYATDGRVELTARWTSVISVDVPSAVTFYADVVTQGNESREGAVDSAFGQNKVASQSEVDLRIVGLESEQVRGDGSTALGASDILKKAEGVTPSSSTQKLFSLYPTSKALTPDDLQDPDAVSAAKPADAVDFALDDLLLEKSFAADKFTIPAGDTLNLGYRLNLSETGTELDYDKLSTLGEGQSASIANISYCFAADALPSDWGEPLWIENPDQTLNPAKYLLLDDIKEAAEDLSAKGTSSAYYSMYKGMLDRQVMSNGNPGAGPYFKVNIDGVYWDLQLIGICQDTRTTDGKKAGLTFQTRDLYAYGNLIKYPSSGEYPTYMNQSAANSGGWASSAQRNLMRTTLYGRLDGRLQSAIARVTKHHQLPGGTTSAYLQRTTNETIWLPSAYEVFGAVRSTYNESEGLTTVSGYAPFQYMAYQGNNGSTTNTKAMKKARASATSSASGQPWLRSACRYANSIFCAMNTNGVLSNFGADASAGIAPAFCL